MRWKRWTGRGARKREVLIRTGSHTRYISRLERHLSSIYIRVGEAELSVLRLVEHLCSSLTPSHSDHKSFFVCTSEQFELLRWTKEMQANVGLKWEELRREARRLENDVDAKLLTFSKFAAQDAREQSDIPSESCPLLDASRDVFEDISTEIEEMIGKLADINGRMGEYCQQMQNPSVVYTLQRHREILNDYRNEFQKTKSNIMAQMERRQLLSVVKGTEEYKSSPSSGRHTDLYLKEKEHIQSSDRLLDEQIEVGLRTRENLRTQRTALKAIQTKMTTLANRFPVINSLIHRINIKRRKDSIIIGSVVGVCLFLFIFFKF